MVRDTTLATSLGQQNKQKQKEQDISGWLGIQSTKYTTQYRCIRQRPKINNNVPIGLFA
jgi:hypothetical protein